VLSRLLEGLAAGLAPATVLAPDATAALAGLDFRADGSSSLDLDAGTELALDRDDEPGAPAGPVVTTSLLEFVAASDSSAMVIVALLVDLLPAVGPAA